MLQSMGSQGTGHDLATEPQPNVPTADLDSGDEAMNRVPVLMELMS